MYRFIEDVIVRDIILQVFKPVRFESEIFEIRADVMHLDRAGI